MRNSILKNASASFHVFAAAPFLFAAFALDQMPAYGNEAATAEAAELKQADTAFYRAFEQRNLWEMSQLWLQADYVSAIHPAHATPFLNWDNVRMSWRQTFAHNRDIKIRQRAGFVHSIGSVAWVIDSTRFESIQTQTGQPILMDNVLATKIFEKHGNQWRLVHYHAHLPNLDMQAQAHEHSDIRGKATAGLADGITQATSDFYKAFAQRDLGAMGQVWAQSDYVSAVHPDYPAPFLGWDQVKTSWRQTFAYSRDIRIHPYVAENPISGPGSGMFATAQFDPIGHWPALHVRNAGSVAWIIDSIRFDAVQTETRQPIHIDNVLTTQIFEKHQDTWLLVHFHAHRGPSAH